MGTWVGVAAGAALLVAVGALVVGHQATTGKELDASTAPLASSTAGAVVDAASGRNDVAYDWPTGEVAPVLRAFDGPGTPWSAGHRGVDLALDEGAPVLAAADGVVVFAGRVVDRGVVSIDHDDGVRTTYEPVEPAVTQGRRVSSGDVIGALTGRSHCAPAACLHWGARRGAEVYIDPMGLLREEVVIRLLPRAGRG